jgi:hypothetical protein
MNRQTSAVELIFNLAAPPIVTKLGLHAMRNQRVHWQKAGWWNVRQVKRSWITARHKDQTTVDVPLLTRQQGGRASLGVSGDLARQSVNRTIAPESGHHGDRSE